MTAHTLALDAEAATFWRTHVLPFTALKSLTDTEEVVLSVEEELWTSTQQFPPDLRACVVEIVFLEVVILEAPTESPFAALRSRLADLRADLRRRAPRDDLTHRAFRQQELPPGDVALSEINTNSHPGPSDPDYEQVS